MNLLKKKYHIKKYLFLLLPVFFVFSFKCLSNESQSDTGPVPIYDFNSSAPWYIYNQAPWPKGTVVVTAFEKEYQHFTGENRRKIESNVMFPENQNWSQVGLLLELGCPEGGTCDHWDRTASVQLALGPEDNESESEYVELLRYITPYRMGMSQYVDVTDYMYLLRGERKISSFIDTWVGPGHDNGDGWTVTLRFVFYPGQQTGADEVLNIWGMRRIEVGNVDEGKSVADQLENIKFVNPIKAKRVMAHLRTTGHGFGYSNNCAEFCGMRQDLYINGKVFSTNPWRSDCENNPVSPQYGTWTYDRNGWCPGAVSVPRKINITSALDLEEGAENTVSFDIRLLDGSVYVNKENAGGSPSENVSLVLLYYQ